MRPDRIFEVAMPVKICARSTNGHGGRPPKLKQRLFQVFAFVAYRRFTLISKVILNIHR